MLTATPGHGRITRVTFATNDDNPAATTARIVPNLTLPPGEEPMELDAPANVVASVDLVLPHGNKDYATGAILRFTDSDAAKAFGRAAYRAAVLLGQTVPASALSTIEAPTPDDVAGLPDVTYAHAGLPSED